MKTKIILSILAFGIIGSVFSQGNTISLTFSAENNGQSVTLDSILIENLTQGGDTTLYSPDTILVLDYITSIFPNDASENNNFLVSQNYPNPFVGKTIFNLYLHKREDINIIVRDNIGRELYQYKNTLEKGMHSFTFHSGNEKYYLLTATGNKTSKTIKMLNINTNSTNSGICKIVYNEYEDKIISNKSQKSISDFVFTLGDQLRFIGYAKTINWIIGSDIIEDSPQTSTDYKLEITEGIPCPSVPSIIYEGQEYNTVLIGSQCWIKQNLNVGTMINGDQNQSNNSIIEKYCFNNNIVNCETYGGLYQWDEMMQYVTIEGTQGICPTGWHLPTDYEWCTLENEVDNGYVSCNTTGWRGLDAGGNLKETSTNHWTVPNSGATNSSGFTGLPGGYRNTLGMFFDLMDYSLFRSSTEYGSDTWTRYLHYSDGLVGRDSASKLGGFSVRCIKD